MLPVIKNFREVVENKDIGRMHKELYEFLHLHCGFIAHFDINGFKATYKNPRDFAEVFIRHFDREHPYYSGIYPCHNEAYKDTGLTKAHIKLEFERIVSRHKDEISRWAEEQQKQDRYTHYLKLKEEFEGGETHDHGI